MQLFFQRNIKKPLFELDADESKHLTRVLRKKAGDHVSVTNGEGELFECVIEEANPKKTTLRIVSTQQIEPDNFHIHLAIAPTKNSDRMEWMVEKITEIGVHEISLLKTKNSERNYLKTERLEKKILAACKQSLKFHTPKLNAVMDIHDFFKLHEGEKSTQKFIAYVDEHNDQHLFDAAKATGNYIILIGPEGDFDPVEIKKAFEYQYKAVSLGKARLRTETAGLAAIQMIQTLNR